MDLRVAWAKLDREWPLPRVGGGTDRRSPGPPRQQLTDPRLSQWALRELHGGSTRAKARRRRVALGAALLDQLDHSNGLVYESLSMVVGWVAAACLGAADE